MNETSDGVSEHIPGTIKVIGIGQSLRGDDAAGLSAVRLWHETFQANINRPVVQMELAELPGISLLSLLEGTRVAILVDAMHGNAKIGEARVFTEEQLESFESGSGSAHGWGVAETLLLGRKLMPSSFPEKLILIGIEAGQMELGGKLSPQVESALPLVASLIEQSIQSSLPLG